MTKEEYLRQSEESVVQQERDLRALGLPDEQVKRAMEPMLCFLAGLKEEARCQT